MGIVSKGVGYIPSIVASLHDSTPRIESLVREVRTKLLETNQIVSFKESDLIPNVEELSLATVDGGVAVDQLAFSNLIVSGATVGEGFESKKVYVEEEDIPSLVFFQLFPHRSDVAKSLPGALMASQELSLMGHLPHDVRILDGSWASSMTSVYLGVLKSPEVLRAVVESALMQRLSSGWSGWELIQGIDQVSAPWKSAQGELGTIALSKSDSSVVWVQRLARGYGFETEGMGLTDRTLAGMVLEPGELLRPVASQIGSGLSRQLDRPNIEFPSDGFMSDLVGVATGAEEQEFGGLSKLSDQARRERKKFIEDFVMSLFYSSNSENEDMGERLRRVWTERWVYGTYFMPTQFTSKHRALRLEFARPQNAAGDLDQVIDKAVRLAGIVDKDLVSPEIFEPWSQYVADRRAKEVSQLKQAVLNALIQGSTNSRILSGLLRGYRT